MTRKEMVSAIVDMQIKKGTCTPEKRAFQIKARLKMWSYNECLYWYNAIINK